MKYVVSVPPISSIAPRLSSMGIGLNGFFDFKAVARGASKDGLVCPLSDLALIIWPSRDCREAHIGDATAVKLLRCGVAEVMIEGFAHGYWTDDDFVSLIGADIYSGMRIDGIVRISSEERWYLVNLTGTLEKALEQGRVSVVRR